MLHLLLYRSSSLRSIPLCFGASSGLFLSSYCLLCGVGEQVPAAAPIVRQRCLELLQHSREGLRAPQAPKALIVALFAAGDGSIDVQLEGARFGTRMARDRVNANLESHGMTMLKSKIKVACMEEAVHIIPFQWKTLVMATALPLLPYF